MLIEDESIEHCWVILGRTNHYLWWGQLVKISSGTSSSVEFDAKQILQFEEDKGTVLGFFHNHPNFPAIPSIRDYHTMNAWADSFGKPLLCAIQGEGGLKSYEFIGKHCPKMSPFVKIIGDVIFGVWYDGFIPKDNSKEIISDDT